jgi:hypothetical protein
MIRLFWLALAACTLLAGDSAAPYKMEITLERMAGSEWRTVDPGLVLDSGDRVRFRFRGNFDGYLYVMNYGTSGSYTLLFPREETGENNRVASGKEYLVPATEAWFRIAGPPGHDTVYWLVSPIELNEANQPGRLPPPPKTSARPLTLMPRCDDSIFRARGLCIDSSAGLKPLSDKDTLPRNLQAVERDTSRELMIMRKQDQALVSVQAPLQGPIIYEFRIAHR